MSTFNTRALAGHRVLVTGVDDGNVSHSTILDAGQWDKLKGHTNFLSAINAYDKQVEEFFAPLTEAAEKLEAAKKVNTDPAFYVVLEEGTPATEAKPEVLVHLYHDTVILRLLEEGREDRLVWVDNTIQILAEVSDADGPADEPMLDTPPF